jgi:prophage regulatory protein
MQPNQILPPRVERLPQVVARVGLSRASIYRRLAAGGDGFPPPFRLGRSIVWDSRSIDRWIGDCSGEG